MSASSGYRHSLAGDCSTSPRLWHSSALCHTFRRCPTRSTSSDFRWGALYRSYCSRQHGWNSSQLHTESHRSGN